MTPIERVRECIESVYNDNSVVSAMTEYQIERMKEALTIIDKHIRYYIEFRRERIHEKQEILRKHFEPDGTKE